MSMTLAKLTAGLARLFSTMASWRRDTGEDATRRTIAEMLEAYYLNNGLYLELARLLTDAGENPESMKAMRNPMPSAVEFYADLAIPGQLPDALPIETKNDKIIEPIHQVWEWSNWSQKKQVAARELPMTGNLFLRVSDNHTDVAKADKVFIAVVKSKHVSSFSVDPQGLVTNIRIEIGKMIDGHSDGIHTEIWDEIGQSIWLHRKGLNASIEKLGTPDEQTTLSAMSLDAIPYVHASFIDLGDDEGLSVIWVALEKINEVNRKATRLSEMMYRWQKPLWLLTREEGSDGQALAPIGMGDSDNVVKMGDESFLSLPSGGGLDLMVPKIDHAAYVAQILADLDEIKRDIPEMMWYEIATENNLSGRALFYKMAPARVRLLQMRGTIEAALAQADIMALKLGQGLSIFSDLGEDFEHSFQKRGVLPVANEDKVATVKIAVEAGMSLANALIEYGGMTQDKANEIAGESEDAVTAELKLAQEDAIVAAGAAEMQTILERVILTAGEGAANAISANTIAAAEANARAEENG